MNDDEFFDEELALSVLLKDGILFFNERDYHFKGEKSGTTTVLFVICNDIFSWGCADAEDLPNNQIKSLYEYHLKDKTWGSTKWCCIKRNEKPQAPCVKMMKEDESWDGVMESLPENNYDKLCKEEYGEHCLDRYNCDSGSKKV